MKTTILLVLALAASAIGAPGVLAQEGDSPLKWAARKARMATDPAKPADFVAATRPPEGSQSYIGVGEQRPTRALKPLDAAGVKGREASFEALNARNQRLIAGKPAKPPPPTLPPAALKARAEHEAALRARQKTN
jgi:hypothetical protein